jgi:hypothetical protein
MTPTPTSLRQTWQQRWRDRSPTSETVEDSILLRSLVQVLVSVGMASVSVAAAGVTDVSYLNLLAIPLSALGGYWSWKARHRRNITVKFLIAFGMLMALGIFLAGLVGRESDTRIQLAELLIHLQVLHSFDMPRRKDLGYSIVIGLILLGVAATVSQSLTFAPLLIYFWPLSCRSSFSTISHGYSCCRYRRGRTCKRPSSQAIAMAVAADSGLRTGDLCGHAPPAGIPDSQFSPQRHDRFSGGI